MNKNKKKQKFSLNRSISMNEELTALNSSFSHPINEEDQYEDSDGQKKEVKRQIGIFEEFKIKYDELRNQNQSKRNQIDELKRLNKRQQIQLLNINTEFYDKEIKRLRAEVDKLQEESQDFKYKYFQVENKRKELESSLSVKQKQMTKIIKQLQTEKVQNVELKHQLKENQKQYMKIIQTIEESSNKSAEKYTECQTKLNANENQLRKIKRDLQNENKNFAKLQKAKKQLQEQNKKTIEKNQIQTKNLKKQLEDSQDQCRQYRKQISSFKQKIAQLTLQMNKSKSLSDFQTTKNLEKITQFRSTRLLEIQNKRFKEENEILKKQIQNKSHSLNTIQIRLNECRQQIQLQKKQHDQEINLIHKKKAAVQKHYESKNLAISKELQILKIKNTRRQTEQQKRIQQVISDKLTRSQSNFFQGNSKKDESPLVAFQNSVEQILQGKDKEITQLKKSLNQKIEEIYRLKEETEQLQIASESMKNEISILEKKMSVQQKNISSKNQFQFLQMKSQIESLERKLSKAETKIQVKVKQIKQKDAFIVDSIIGRIQKQEDAPLMLAEMQRVLQAGYIQRLADAQRKIRSFESNMAVKSE